MPGEDVFGQYSQTKALAYVWHSLSLTVCVPAAQNVRVVQRNLVYVVGLAMDVCYEDVLQSAEHFGQFGKVVKARCSLLIRRVGTGAAGGPRVALLDDVARGCVGGADLGEQGGAVWRHKCQEQAHRQRIHNVSSE